MIIDFTRDHRAGYTQNNEEFHILEAFKNKPAGRFLDIGAHDGKSFSSTRALAERGWRGTYVEPDPGVLPKLYENTRAFGDRVEVLPVAIGTTEGLLTFYSSQGDLVGTLSESHVERWTQKNASFTPVKVNVVKLSTLAASRGTNYDFVNLDVEGINWEVFQQFDWTVWKPRCVCIEYDDKIQEIADILRNNGYLIKYVSAENIVAVRRELRWTGRGFTST
jgi:FkbM family methyltransferase